MAQFAYVAQTIDGQRLTGTFEETDIISARAALAERELVSFTVEPKKSIWQLELTRKRVPARELMHFSRQLAAFVGAGVPILDALRTLQEETDNSTFRSVLESVISDVRGGSTLSGAVAAHPKVFPNFFIGMLESAELSGKLDTVLAQISEYLERDIDARRKIKSALTYPIVILVVALLTVVILTGFVLPRFEVFFESLDADLPLPTRIMLGVSEFVVTWWWALLASIAIFVLALYLAQRTDGGRMGRDRLLLRIPAIGGVLRYASIERFCRVLASMVNAGVPLPQAMTVVADTTTNRVYNTGIFRARAAMLEGQGLSGPISETGLFPSTVTQMVRVGEDTGTLDDQLNNAARYYERELDYKIKGMTAMFEPAVLIFVGLLVGFVAIALVSAMYGIFRQANAV